MIMCTFRLAAVSNWELYQRFHGDGGMETYAGYLAGLVSPQKEMALKPDFLIIREKSLTEEKYLELFRMVWGQCEGFQGKVVPHTYLSAARQAGCGCIHLPFPLLEKYQQWEGISRVGVSVHSLEEAKQAERWGASYLTAGHIFQTGCKQGLPPRGTRFLEKVCSSVSIPVFAIGGISPGNLGLVKDAAAAGACMMSEYMKA